jgi:cytochrome c oxidase cbb3-type subunit 3
VTGYRLAACVLALVMGAGAVATPLARAEAGAPPGAPAASRTSQTTQPRQASQTPLAAAAAASAAAAAATDPALQARLDLGRQVYNARCYFCHGYSGDARTQAAAMLQPPPRDFTREPALGATSIRQTLEQGRPGTAMASFAGLLDAAEMAAVADFVVAEFVRARAPNTAYHTPENGWPDHQRYADAYDFALGRLPVDTPDAQLNQAQRRGLALYLSACVACHDSGDATPLHWATRPASFPRPGIEVGGTPAVDAVSGASVYAAHEQAPRLKGLTSRERRGERLFQANCAFCHAPDGSGRNWIGQFMEPPARDLRLLDAAALARLPNTIRDGLPGRAMPAWRDVLKPADIAAVAVYVKRAFAARATKR